MPTPAEALISDLKAEIQDAIDKGRLQNGNITIIINGNRYKLINIGSHNVETRTQSGGNSSIKANGDLVGVEYQDDNSINYIRFMHHINFDLTVELV